MSFHTIISPVDGKEVAKVPLVDKNEAIAIVEKSNEAQKKWRDTPLSTRKEICSKFVKHFIAKRQEIAEELTRLMGRPITQTPWEVDTTKTRAEYMIQVCEEALQDILVEDSANFKRFIRREALGVVLVIGAWNYPYLISVNCVIPALLAGNSVILKQAPQTFLCANRFADAFKEAGLPEGVFQVLHADHQVCESVIQHPSISFINFTGSVAGGHAVCKLASSKFIATGLELGGKDPAYIRADVHLEHAVPNTVDGAFFNSGQCCCAIERIYVHHSIYDKFVEMFVEEVKKYKLGNPLDEKVNLGPLVKTGAADTVRDHIKDALSKGAKALIDEKFFEASKEGTPYLGPQVLVDVNHSMKVMMDETFGPVVGIMKVQDDEEAIRLMNDSPFGLTASIWTNDVEAALKIGNRIETGTWFMNRCDYLDPALAWVGVKDSGRGCSLSKLAFENLTRPKSFHLRYVTKI